MAATEATDRTEATAVTAVGRLFLANKKRLRILPLPPALGVLAMPAPVHVNKKEEDKVGKPCPSVWKAQGMYAVIRTGGRQFRVSEGQKIRVEKLPGNAGDKITINEVLLVGGDAPKIGKPLVTGASVSAEISEQDRGKKIVVFKFRRRKNYRRKNGHRQPYTVLKITGISA